MTKSTTPPAGNSDGIARGMLQMLALLDRVGRTFDRIGRAALSPMAASSERRSGFAQVTKDAFTLTRAASMGGKGFSDFASILKRTETAVDHAKDGFADAGVAVEQALTRVRSAIQKAAPADLRRLNMTTADAGVQSRAPVFARSMANDRIQAAQETARISRTDALRRAEQVRLRVLTSGMPGSAGADRTTDAAAQVPLGQRLPLAPRTWGKPQAPQAGPEVEPVRTPADDANRARAMADAALGVALGAGLARAGAFFAHNDVHTPAPQPQAAAGAAPPRPPRRPTGTDIQPAPDDLPRPSRGDSPPVRRTIAGRPVSDPLQRAALASESRRFANVGAQQASEYSRLALPSTMEAAIARLRAKIDRSLRAAFEGAGEVEAGRTPEGARGLSEEARAQRSAAASKLEMEVTRQRFRAADAHSPEGADDLQRQAQMRLEHDTNKLAERVEGEERAVQALREGSDQLRDQLALERRLAAAARERADLVRRQKMAWASEPAQGQGQGQGPGARAGWSNGMTEAAQRTADRLGGMRERVDTARHEADYRRTSQGRQDSREERRLQRRALWEQDRGQGGTMFAGLKAAERFTDGLAQKFQGAAEAGQRMFAALTVSAAGFASIGDPFVAWPTLMGSFKDLAQSIGQSLSPMLMEMSGHLQRAAAFVRGLSDEFKTNAVRVAIWVGGAALGVTVVYKLIIAAKALVVALGSVRAALWSTGIGLAVGVVGALAGEYMLLADKASDAAKAMGNAGHAAGVLPRAQRAQNTIKEEDLREVPEVHRKKILEAGADREKLQQALQEFQAAAEKALKEAAPKSIPDLADRMRRDERMEQILGAKGGVYEQAEKYRVKVQTTRREFHDIEQLPDEKILRGLLDWVQPNNAKVERARIGMLRSEQDITEARKLSSQALSELRRSGIKIFETFERGEGGQVDFTRRKAGVTEKDVEEARKRGETPESDVLGRMLSATRRGAGDDPDKWFGDNFRRWEAILSGFQMNANFLRLERNQKLAQGLVEKSGGQPGMLINQKWPVQPQISDALAWADRIQIQALDGGDLDKEILRRQLDVGQKTLEEIQGLRQDMQRNNQPNAPQAPKNDKR